jgi:hypothetical protein
VLTNLRKVEPFCRTVCWRYRGAGKVRLDSAAAWAYAVSPGAANTGLDYAELSPDERELRDEATARRLESVAN